MGDKMSDIQDKLDYKGLAKKAYEAFDETKQRQLLEDMDNMRAYHFLDKLEDEEKRGKEPYELAQLVREKTEYKVDNHKEADYLADQLTLRVLKEISPIHADTFGKALETLKDSNASKEEKENAETAIDHTRESMRLYGLDHNELSQEGYQKGFTKELWQKYQQQIVPRVSNYMTHRHLYKIKDKKSLADHIVEESEKNEELPSLDKNGIYNLNIDELRSLLLGIHHNPKAIEKEYKHLIKEKKE